MAERKAVNKYYPPEWTPSKGGINKFRGTHPLRERARKLNQGILIIRFEMPYNIWCEGCNNHIGMGVRYNAEKTKTGMYFSTPIFKFRMKCHLCVSHFEMQTDPKNLDYTILNGARRQERRWDPEENEQVVTEDKEISKKLQTDSMFQLEHGVEDKKKSQNLIVSEIEDIQERWKEDYLMNKALRNKFRIRKKEIQAQEAKDKMFLTRASLDIALLPESEEDKQKAQLIKLSNVVSVDEIQKEKREALANSSFFSKTPLEAAKSADLTSKIIPLVHQKRVSEMGHLSRTKLGIVSKKESKAFTTKIPKSGLVCNDYGSSSDSEN